MAPETFHLDISGQLCPSCLLLTLKEVNRVAGAIRSGAAEIVVTTDDRQATATIPEAVARMGFRAEVSRDDEAGHDGARYRLRIHAA